MAILKSNFKKNEYKLKSSYKKNGLCCWRYYFYAREESTGKEVPFFIELLIENPAVSPTEVVLQKKSKQKINLEDLQNALAGGYDSQKDLNDNFVTPSFVAVRAGVYGDERKQINCFYPTQDLVIDKKRFFVSIANNIFSDDTLSGSLTCLKSTALQNPEYMSQDGSIQWNLHYERRIDFQEISTSEDCFWLPSGINCSYSGRITLDSVEYVVSPKFSYGYCDKLWGRTFPIPFFNLSSTKLKSIFSGKFLEDSCFSFQGIYQNKIAFLAKLENDSFAFVPKKDKYEEVHNCLSVPGQEDEEQLHWSVSLNDKNYVCDVDIFCSAKSMLIRNYEIPSGNGKSQVILSGYNGTGELRIYKKVKKNLELIHHVEIQNCINEFGEVE